MGNEYTKCEYLFWGLIFFTFTYWCYGRGFFINIPGTSSMTSKIVLLSAGVILFFINFILIQKWNRNYNNMLISVIFPLYIYTIASYYPYKKMLIISIVTITLFVGLFLTAISVMGNVDIPLSKSTSKYKKRLRKIKSRMVYKQWERVLAASMIALFACLIFKIDILGGLITPKIKAAAEQDDIWTIEANADKLLPLADEELWRNLSLQDKIDIMQLVLNIQAHDMNYKYSMEVAASELGKGVLGATSYEKATVYIDIDHLKDDSAESCLNTILHESLHIAQHFYVELYEKLDEEEKNTYFIKYSMAAVYADEIKNYEDGHDNIEKYYNQTLEKDARNYGKYTTSKYLLTIKESTSKGVM